VSVRDRNGSVRRKRLDMDQSGLGEPFFNLGREDIAKRIEDDERAENKIEREKKIKKDLPENDHGP